MRSFLTLALLLALTGPALAGTSPAVRKAPVKAKAPAQPVPDMVVPDLTRFFGTWLWVKSDGAIATSSPETKGAARTLILNPDFSYELHQRRDTRDSVLCRGGFNFSEETSGGLTSNFLDFAGWFETYEHRMSADFSGPDTLLLSGDRCENCPEHTYARGRTTTFEASVTSGQRFRRDLWDGLRFELVPQELGWKIAIRDTTRPDEDLAALTPPFHFAPNPCDIEGWHFRDKANQGPNHGDVNAPQRVREFIFAPEVPRLLAQHGTAGISAEDVDRVEGQGRGVLEVEDLELTPPARNEQAGIRSMRFRVAIETAVRPGRTP